MTIFMRRIFAVVSHSIRSVISQFFDMIQYLNFILFEFTSFCAISLKDFIIQWLIEKKILVFLRNNIRKQGKKAKRSFLGAG